ncbi:MAG: hypothetical protein D6705_12015 [Deltaproteobacteria bacterium]|nr:MAG: hypothetical protein D6705_12015 [Deltaproteobacteria bacterium]
MGPLGIDAADVATRSLPFVVLALLPLVAVAATALAKALVVTAALRTGLSAERLLPGPVVWMLGFLLAGIVMLPTFEGAWTAFGQPEVDLAAVGRAALEPWLEFLGRHAAPEERAFLAELTGRSTGDPLVVVAGFFLTELAQGLHMAVAILAPFLAVDLLVAQALVLASMTNVPAQVVSLPIKLALFLAADGVHLLVRGFVESYP